MAGLMADALTANDGRAVMAGTERAPLVVKNVGKSFVRRGADPSTSLKVLDDISLTVQEGEFTTIIGPSGCGKSTLLNAIGGLTPIDTGSMVLDGKALSGPSPEISFVFQQASLLPWRTIEANVAYGLELRRTVPRKLIREQARDAMRRVGLSGFESHYPHEISGGMQQRANLARALTVAPRLVLMDEPFGALDALTKEVLQDELSNLAMATRLSTVFITHDIGEALFLGDTVLVMSARPGKIIREIKMPAERPRDRAIMESPQFKEIVGELHSLLRPART